MKKIWLINPYGPIPTEEWRDYSFSIFGKYLAEQGYEVIWWTSNFSHHFKEYRSKGLEDIDITPGFKVRLIPTTKYKNNIGLGRIIRDWVFSIRTYQMGKKEESPDLIIYYESQLCLGYAAPALAKFHNCPLVYDQMDLWPELMIDSSPKYIQGFLRLILYPVFVKRKKVFKNLNGLIALAQPYLDHVLKIAPNIEEKPNEVIYNGINVSEFRLKMLRKSPVDLSKVNTNNIKIIFAGSLGPSYDIYSILDVAKKINKQNLPISILIAGDGPARSDVEKAHEALPNLHYFGKMKPDELCTVFNICDIGLAAYGSSSNVEMPDKFYDYTAASLAIICSLKGEVLQKVVNHKVGLEYEGGNPDSLLDAIIKFSSGELDIEQFKINSFNLANEFSSESQNKKLLSFVEAMLDS